MQRRFTGNFTQQLPIPEAGITEAVAVLRSGRLHRYNIAEDEVAQTTLLEQEFAAYLGVPYCVAVASGGYALQTALRALGVAPGDCVLTNGFTLSPVPGAITAVGALPVLVEITDDLVIDLDDLKTKCMSSKARVLMLSHMRGHIVDMDALMEVARECEVAVVEDCAHTMGAFWDDVPSGRHGVMACYSTQTYKHINSGEGGLLVSHDAELMAKATLLSGSYMLYHRHEAVPSEAVFDEVRLGTPNCSGRMDNLRAAILRPQLAVLEQSVKSWNERYRCVATQLGKVDRLRLPNRPAAERYVGSSIQFFFEDLDEPEVDSFLESCAARGVELKWFGREEPVAFTSRYDSWQYLQSQPLPNTDVILSRLFDMRIPLTFSLEDCALIGTIIAESATAMPAKPAR